MKILCANPLAQYEKYSHEINASINNVLSSGKYILSDQVSALEKEFSSFLDVNYAVGVANGTDALELVLRSLDIGYGDEVITVSHTAIATVSAIESTGAIPVLTDINFETFTIDPDKIVNLITPKTKAIIPVHIYGCGADLTALQEICDKYRIHLIEDCSQAHGLKINKNGTRVGTIGIAGCFSCYPTKNLGGIGDAGLISTKSFDLFKKLRSIRQYGWEDRSDSLHHGRNSRLDEIQAAILRIKLKYLDKNNLRRKKIAEFYFENLKKYDLKLPSIENGDHVFHLYVIRSEKRNELKNYLQKNGIFAGIHYPIPIHKQTIYKDKIKKHELMLNTEIAAKEILSLPMYPELTEKELEYIISTFKKYFDRKD